MLSLKMDGTLQHEHGYPWLCDLCVSQKALELHIKPETVKQIWLSVHYRKQRRNLAQESMLIARRATAKELMTLWFFLLVASLGLLFLILLLFPLPAHAETVYGLASFYTEESCKREGTSGIWTANGERFREDQLTCAMRSRDFGGRYLVTSLSTGRSVVVRHNDFGPGKKATRRGVVIDLSPASYRAIGLSERAGRGKVKVKRIR